MSGAGGASRMGVGRASILCTCALSVILSAGVSLLTAGGALVVTSDGTPAAWDTSVDGSEPGGAVRKLAFLSILM